MIGLLLFVSYLQDAINFREYSIMKLGTLLIELAMWMSIGDCLLTDCRLNKKIVPN